jgi:prepilin-type N-terminal cleavage/methylation domain-containing protein
MHFLPKYNIKGFTLIELLVVISIIGILSSFAMVSLNSARSKARDAKRKADMNNLRTALFMYYDEHFQWMILMEFIWALLLTMDQTVITRFWPML